MSAGLVSRLLTGLRDTARLLSPAVRAERAYTTARARLVAEAMGRARRGEPWLAPGYGRGLDERVVELPWVFERLGRGAALLDVGSTLNHPDTLALALESFDSVLFVNPYRDDGWRSASPRVRYVRGDARALPAVGRFAVVTCLSVLEHVGCDNTRYGAAAPAAGAARPADTRAAHAAHAARAAAMAGLRAALAPGGRLLLTVPFGRAERHGWFEQLDAAAVAEMEAAFRPAHMRATYFLHDAGWRTATAMECAGAAYGTATRGATAVACLELTA